MNSDPYRNRRSRLISLLRKAGGGIAIVPTASEKLRNGDSDFPFRHDSYFHYLTGFDEPKSCLVLTSDGRSILFCRTRDPEREIWEGHRLGPEAALQVLGVDEANSIEKLDEYMPNFLNHHDAVWTLFEVPSGIDQRLATWLTVVRNRKHQGAEGPTHHRDLGQLLDEMRLFKDAHELNTMRRAAAISAEGHRRSMRFCADRFKASPNGTLREYELEAELLHEFRRHGAQSPAYTSIVAAGANACILHYAAGNAELKSGDLCLIDAGCELDGYASDITRTFPVNGRFSVAQRELYDIVVAAQEAAIASTRPGERQRDAHHAAVRVLAQGMLDTGLLKRDLHGDVDNVIDTAAYRQFYMHGTGHWLGRDVHDVGEYLSIQESPFEQPDGMAGKVVKRPSRQLQPGMVLTIEPGLYVRPAEGVPEQYWNIGIRIEDDAVVTATGCELISRNVPVNADEIEALMR